jgi:cytochrome c
MKKLLIISIGLISILSANGAAELFKSKCAICHPLQAKDKSSLKGPPIGKVMMQVKNSFPKKEDGVVFIKDFSLNPDPKKTICPSIDLFGVMPSQKGVVSKEELDEIANYLYDTFPTKMMKKKMLQEVGDFTFEDIDSNKDGFITKEEFNNFRGKKDNIDPKKFKYDYFFKRIDTNNDGKWDKEEFKVFEQMMKGKKN